MVGKLDTRLARLKETYDAQSSEFFEQLKQRFDQLSRHISPTTLRVVAKVLKAMAGRQKTSDDVYPPTDEIHRDLSMRFGKLDGFCCGCPQTPGVEIEGELVRDCWYLALGEFMISPLRGERLQAVCCQTPPELSKKVKL